MIFGRVGAKSAVEPSGGAFLAWPVTFGFGRSRLWLDTTARKEPSETEYNHF